MGESELCDELLAALRCCLADLEGFSRLHGGDGIYETDKWESVMAARAVIARAEKSEGASPQADPLTATSPEAEEA